MSIEVQREVLKQQHVVTVKEASSSSNYNFDINCVCGWHGVADGELTAEQVGKAHQNARVRKLSKRF
jgi:uncharacterized protein YgiM (DUF1202 family)